MIVKTLGLVNFYNGNLFGYWATRELFSSQLRLQILSV
jgi:hypothetical protein